ncbi:hypothetical protein [Vibrio metschnikovii]|uniref:Uncharacterized protein n=1 Tax=Vibrio metschnikovii TaxID=28172 RepID=A0A9X0RAX1_VIBME|nr:hypothetical protein [Vibrio metschnikovii]MBC5853034.1 hypothetical protein [Vibrio metschnikovii]
MDKLKVIIDQLRKRISDYDINLEKLSDNISFNHYLSFDEHLIVGEHCIFLRHKKENRDYYKYIRREIPKFKFSHPVIGINFEYLGSKNPKIQFSFHDFSCNGKPELSIPFDFSDFKKTFEMSLNNDLFNEDLIYHLKEVFLEGKMDESLKAKIAEQNDEYENECRSFGEYIDTELNKAAALAISFKKAKQTSLKELSEFTQEVERSEEYALVNQLKAQLKDAELKLEDKKSSLFKERPSLVESQKLINELQDPENGIAFKIYSIYQGIAEKIMTENGLTKSARLCKFKGLKNKVFEILNHASLHLPNRWKVKISEIEVQVKNNKRTH